MASLKSLVLAVLESDGPLHGYGIAREIERRSSDVLSFGEGSLYPALQQLSKSKLIVDSWQTEGSGPARRCYSLTEDGKRELVKIREEWNRYARGVEAVLCPSN